MTHEQRRLIGDRPVGPIGLGTAALSLDDVRDDQSALTTIRDAIEAGVTLIDTAHAYTTLDEPTHAERLVRDAVAGHASRENLFIATKGGHWRSGHAEFPIDGTPATLRAHLDASLRALDVDAIDLYQLHHPDPRVPIEESVGALAEFQQAGLVRLIGLSNVERVLVDRAIDVAPIASVQNQLSPFRTDDLALIATLADLGIAYLSHSPFGGWARGPLLEQSLPVATGIADARRCTLRQVVLVWQLSVAPNVSRSWGRGAAHPSRLRRPPRMCRCRRTNSASCMTRSQRPAP